MTPERAAREARRVLRAQARPVSRFDASRYFRGDSELRFLNVGTAEVRRLAGSIRREQGARWTVDDAMTFANQLVGDRELEAKGLAIEVVAGYRSSFRPALLTAWRRWFVRNHASNWATTDQIGGMLIGPLLLACPALAPKMRLWAAHRNPWVRRVAAVSLIPSIRRGLQLDLAYAIATGLHGDKADLIQKAVGWMLREAGKRDAARLERYLLARGPAIPRLTVRYAIERFSPVKRRRLLAATARSPRSGIRGIVPLPPGVSRRRD